MLGSPEGPLSGKSQLLLIEYPVSARVTLGGRLDLELPVSGARSTGPRRALQTGWVYLAQKEVREVVSRREAEEVRERIYSQWGGNAISFIMFIRYICQMVIYVTEEKVLLSRTHVDPPIGRHSSLPQSFWNWSGVQGGISCG